MTNEEIARVLSRAAEAVALSDEKPYRAASYRRAAETVRGLAEPVEELLRRQGRAGLEVLGGIGRGLSGAIIEIVETGTLGLLERASRPDDFTRALEELPGIGPMLAARIIGRLGISSLEELESAAHDGRLEAVPGVGAKTARNIRDALAGMLSRAARRDAHRRGEQGGEKSPAVGAAGPPVGLLLAIDAEYRQKAGAGRLRTIAPKRFNPTGRAWLPVMDAAREGWRFSVLFSNTERAHELGRTRDWVVIYYRSEKSDGQCTVVTAEFGPLIGKRVIRGRERECMYYYDEARW